MKFTKIVAEQHVLSGPDQGSLGLTAGDWRSVK